jgi:glucosamine--fructose-6-phosphate aminotransferase (isomerizing)
MCGIVGYIGKENTADILIDSLGKLEYRGYDSAGLALLCGDSLRIIKSFGRIADLREKLPRDMPAMVGIGHTRWATHGKPSEINAHPHQDCTGKIAVVHNGIIENYRELKDMLVSHGHHFVSETDTEVISHLIEDNYRGDTRRAIEATVKLLKGSFGLAIINKDEPGKIFAVKKDSPVVVGIGDGQYFLASDVMAFLKYTKKAVFMEDGEIMVLSGEGVATYDFDGRAIARDSVTVQWDTNAAEKAGYEHYMLKEIHEQPRTLLEVISGRLNELTGEVKLEELSLTEEQVMGIKRILIVACGTSYHAGLAGKYAMEALVGIPVLVEVASEFRYSSSPVENDTLIIALSQSGETADTLAAAKKAARAGSYVVAVTNVADSAISRLANDTILMRSGPEIGVAATKTFTAQVAVMYMLAVYLGRARGKLGAEDARRLIASLKALPQKVQRLLGLESNIASVAKLFKDSRAFYLIGRHLNYPVALEGALKLKEVSYVYSDGYAAGELKHGPLALISANVPVIAIATKCPTYDKMISNIREVAARDASIIAIASEGDGSIDQLAPIVVRVPDACEYTSPILSAVVFQLFAYFAALERGCPIDKPRNLAKCVTVE